MSAHTAKCQSCHEAVAGEIHHLGFSNMDALYCSACPKVLLLKNHDLLVQFGIRWVHAVPGDPTFQEYGRHHLPVYAQVEALFRPCEREGRYGYLNPPRCPKCNGLLRGDLYEDKPVLKNWDGYAFVTSGSVDDAEQLTPEHAQHL